MLRVAIFAGATIAATTTAARAQPASPTADTDTTGVAATVRALFAATERNDLAALDTLYDGARLTIIEGAGINRTWAEYRDHHLAPELKEMRNLRYRPADIEAHVAGDVAWAMFRYALRADVNGRTADVVGRGTTILTRRGTGANARWVVRHMQTSGRARRPGDAPLDG